MKSSKQSKGSRKGGQKFITRLLSDGPSYAGQQKTILRLEGTPQPLSTIVTSGLIAFAQQLQAAQITGFASRFASTFDEYRILGANVRITPMSASVGVSKLWFDEKSTSAPTANEAQERTSVPLANTNAMASSRRTMRWRARDLLDLEYTATSVTNVTPVTFKLYTDVATWGAPAAATVLWLVEPEFLVEFRGIKST